jgi:hypothetical protein
MENSRKHPHLYDPKELGKYFNNPVSDVISNCNTVGCSNIYEDASGRDPFLPVDQV